MKIALCFIINYDHILNKEDIWKQWIEPNKDIINVYFYYKDLHKIKSQWIRNHTIPSNQIFETSYYNVIPAYLSLMNFALQQDTNNTWFCFLTETCCPIVSPKKFRYLFYEYYSKTLLSWKPAWWNIDFHKRANLHFLPEEYRLANDPWFVMKRENVEQCLTFVNKYKDITRNVTSGGLANESLFAIVMHSYKQLEGKEVLSRVTHITDWSRPTSPTSPHLFKDGGEKDIAFIETELEKNVCAMFIRKISLEFPDHLLEHYIYHYSKEKDNMLVLREPPIFFYMRWKSFIMNTFAMSCFFIVVYGFFYINKVMLRF
jgi:hypothetical protein